MVAAKEAKGAVEQSDTESAKLISKHFSIKSLIAMFTMYICIFSDVQQRASARARDVWWWRRCDANAVCLLRMLLG